MKYRVEISAKARKTLSRLDRPVQIRLNAIINGLAENPRPPGRLKIRGEDGWRIRVGDYRIVYTINHRVVAITIIKIDHRENVYR